MLITHIFTLSVNEVKLDLSPRFYLFRVCKSFCLFLPLSFLHPQGGNNLSSKCFPLSRCHSNLWAGRHDNPTMVQR